MSGSLTSGGGENVPGIPGTCTTRNFTYLVRGPLISRQYALFQLGSSILFDHSNGTLLALSENGSIDYNEFCTVMNSIILVSAEKQRNLQAVFDSIDVNGDGKIQDTELKTALTQLTGVEVDLDEARAVIKAVDKDGDGHINFKGQQRPGGNNYVGLTNHTQGHHLKTTEAQP